jgi:hypothetical protein
MGECSVSSILPEGQLYPFGDAKAFVRKVRGNADATKSRVGFSYDGIRAAAKEAGLEAVPFADPTTANQEQLLVAVFAAAAALVEDGEALRADLSATRTYDGSPLESWEHTCASGEPVLLMSVGHGSYVDACIEADGRMTPLTLSTGAPGSVPLYIGTPSRNRPPDGVHCIDSVAGMPLPVRAHDYIRTWNSMWTAGVHGSGKVGLKRVLTFREGELQRCGILLLDVGTGVNVYGYGTRSPQVKLHLYRRLGAVERSAPESWSAAPVKPDASFVYAYRWSGT